MTSLDCLPDVFLLFVYKKYAKMCYFVPPKGSSALKHKRLIASYLIADFFKS